MSPRGVPPVVLTVAGSDSSGGAGIQADLKTFMALGVHGATAVTALTAQNSMGVSRVHAVPAEFVREQIDQVFADADVAAAKTGMLWNGEIIRAVADSFAAAGVKHLVVDPVLVATSKAALSEQDAVRCLVERLLPLASVVTPNLSEASALTGTDVASVEDMKLAAELLAQMGPAWILVKGGHLAGDPVDVLFDGRSFVLLDAPRVRSSDTHGSGCTLAAAIAARLAGGDDVETAVRFAKSFVSGAIQGSFRLGKGPGPVNQAWSLTGEKGGQLE